MSYLYDWPVIDDMISDNGWTTQKEIIESLGIKQQTVSAAYLRGDLPSLDSEPTQLESELERISGIGALLNIVNESNGNSEESEPVLMPVDIVNKFQSVPKTKKRKGSILFITDPHFGFLNRNGNLEPIHHRQFLSNLLALTQAEEIDGIVWGGDMLDLADASRFPSTPDMVNNIQVSLYELAWFLFQIGLNVNWQTVIEGNHDERLQRMLVKTMPFALELRPILNMSGPPHFSIQSLINADDLGIEWVGNYPNGQFRYGDTIFKHGTYARAASGSTVTASAKDRSVNYFYGHCHRMELLRKTLPDTFQTIWVGSPGMAANVDNVPGARKGTNWQLGAFLLNFDEFDCLDGVEIISQKNYDPFMTFRGVQIMGESYLPTILETAPNLVKRLLVPQH